MNRLLSWTALALSLAAGCSDSVEIPTVELGGSSGARLMNEQPRSPADAYERAYSHLARAHYNVRRNLESRGQNQFGAREAMRQILDCLDTMRGCVPAAARSDFDPYLARYGEWLKDLDDGTWGGAFLAELDRTERELRSKFNPDTIEVLPQFPAASRPPKTDRPPPARPAAATPAESGLTPDKVEVPGGQTPAAAGPDHPTPPIAGSGPPAAASATSASPRLLYRSWSSAHDDLITAYRQRKPCKSKYDDVIDSLKLLKSGLAPEKAAKLQIYIEYYSGVEEKTRGFTILPEKTTEKDIIDELDVAARVIRKDFNPDK